MAKSREVRKLDQKRDTSSTDRGITMRLGSFTRSRLRDERGRLEPSGERRQ
jgi:protein tyrosine/serine phosphatase